MAQQYQTAIIVVTHDETSSPTFQRIYHIRDGANPQEAGQGRSVKPWGGGGGGTCCLGLTQTYGRADDGRADERQLNCAFSLGSRRVFNMAPNSSVCCLDP